MVTLLLFALTYAGISARTVPWLPLGRPALALLGAVACVLVGALTDSFSFNDSLRAIDLHTLALLFGMMVVSAGLQVAGFFDVAARALGQLRISGTWQLVLVTVASGVLSALLLNDAVCLLATPLVMTWVLQAKLPPVPFMLAICMGSNAGSAFTLSGNPQNMLVAQLSGLSYAHYTARVALPAVLALAVVATVLVVWFRRELAVAAPTPAPPTASAPTNQPLLWTCILALLGMVVANVCEAPLALSALSAACVVLVASNKRAQLLLLQVDYGVLVFFAALFVLVAALRHTGMPAQALTHVPMDVAGGTWVLAGVLTLGSQVVSNVPLILLLEPWIQTFPDKDTAWTTTALVSTLAGNLTLLGSVANIIVLERTQATLRAHGEPPLAFGFFAYAKVGIPVTLLGVAVAVLCG